MDAVRSWSGVLPSKQKIDKEYLTRRVKNLAQSGGARLSRLAAAVMGVDDWDSHS